MNKKKIFIVVFLVLGIITLLLGSAYALFIFNGKGSINNAKSGQVYLTLNSTNDGLDLNNQKPISDEEGINQDDYYEFSVSGFVTGTNPIIYKISVVNGDSIEGLTRFRDSDIKLYLTNENDEKLVLTTGNDLENGMLVYKDNIIGGTREELVTKTYRLRTWLSNNVLVSNKDIPNKSIYSMEEFNNSYYSVKIKLDSDRVGGPTLALNSTNGRLTVNSLVGANLHNYKIFGNSVQNGTPTPDDPIAVESLGERTKNLFDVTKVNSNYYSNGNIIIPANYDIYVSAGYLKDLCPNLKVGDMVVINATSTSTTGHAVYIFSSSTTWNWGTSHVITDGELDSKIYFYKADSVSDPNASAEVTISNIQIELGSSPTSYEPYGYKIPVKSSGKNLFDINTQYILRNGAIQNVQFAGNSISITQNGGDLIPYIGYIIPITVGKAYTISYGDSNAVMQYMQLDEPITEIGTYYGTRISSGTSFTSSKPYVLINIIAGGIGAIKYMNNIQLEEGPVATSYEPYKETITNIYLDEPLRKVGDSADYIDFEKGEVVRKIGKFVIPSGMPFNGTAEDRVLLAGAQSTVDRKSGAGLSAIWKYGLYGSNYAYLYSDNGIYYWYPDVTAFGVNPGDDNLTIKNPALKTWLSQQSTEIKTIYYELKDPSPTPITLPSIPTFHGVTHLEVVSSNGISPSNMEIEYYD